MEEKNKKKLRITWYSPADKGRPAMCLCCNCARPECPAAKELHEFFQKYGIVTMTTICKYWVDSGTQPVKRNGYAIFEGVPSVKVAPEIDALFD